MAGKVPVGRRRALEGWPAAIGRMNAIQLVKTMAGSPDADARLQGAISVSPSCAWFSGLARSCLREPMKEPRNVRYPYVSKSIGVGVRSRSKPARSPARPTAPSLATYGETIVLATVVAAKTPKPGHRLLPADRELPGKDLRRRPDPRRLLQARRPSDREGDADLPPDRPPDPPAVRRRLPRTRPRSSSPCCRTTWRTIPTSLAHGRGLRRADALRRALHGPDRRRPRRLHQRRVRAQPDASTRWPRASSTSSSPAPPTPC